MSLDTTLIQNEKLRNQSEKIGRLVKDNRILQDRLASMENRLASLERRIDGTDQSAVDSEPVKQSVESKSPDDLDQIKAELDALGVSYHPNTGREKLIAKLEEVRGNDGDYESPKE